MDQITVYLNITTECSPDEGVGVEFPSVSDITINYTYALDASWDVVLYGLVKGLEASYGYPFSKKELHEFVEKYGR